MQTRISFNYEKSIWGYREATVKRSDPAAFRLRQSLSALKNLPSGATVLEVGSGAGQFIRAIKRIRPELMAFGCDISRTAVKKAKERGNGIIYSVSEEKRLPYSNNSLDAVVVFDVMEHLSDPKNMLVEIYRVLKRGGIFYAFVPCEGDYSSFWNALDFFGLKRDLTKKFAGHIQYFSVKDVVRLAEEAGFRVVKRRYSEHLLGQAAGVAAFFLMNRAARKTAGGQINNEVYFSDKSASSAARIFKKIANTLIYLESALLNRFHSPNLHIFADK